MDLATLDLSFISLLKVLPAVVAVMHGSAAGPPWSSKQQQQQQVISESSPAEGGSVGGRRTSSTNSSTDRTSSSDGGIDSTGAFVLDGSGEKGGESERGYPGGVSKTPSKCLPQGVVGESRGWTIDSELVNFQRSSRVAGSEGQASTDLSTSPPDQQVQHEQQQQQQQQHQRHTGEHQLSMAEDTKVHSPAQLVVLIKPQFEAGRAQVCSGGVVRDPKVKAFGAVLEICNSVWSRP